MEQNVDIPVPRGGRQDSLPVPGPSALFPELAGEAFQGFFALSRAGKKVHMSPRVRVHGHTSLSKLSAHEMPASSSTSAAHLDDFWEDEASMWMRPMGSDMEWCRFFLVLQGERVLASASFWSTL